MHALIISDSIFFKSIILNLKKCGISSDNVYNWDEALEILDLFNIYDLIILNDNIAGITLTQMVQTLKNKYPSIKIITIIGNNNNDFLNSSYKNEVYHIFNKPYKIKIFLEVINNFLKENKISKKTLGKKKNNNC